MKQRANALESGIDGPICSICIANYNGLGVIDDCIGSVLAQDCEFPIEIIIHDDASTDGSAQHIRTVYPQVVMIESVDNVGFCVANNRMVERATGEFVLLLNNDAALYPDALATLYKGAQDMGQPAILSLPQYDAATGELLDIGCLLDPFLNPVPSRNPERKDVGMVIGACLWIPKALWRELSGFPEWFGSIGEDLYLCCRARLAGYHVRALGISGYHHQVGTSFGGGKVQGDRLTTTFRRRALSERNKTFVMATCFPGILLIWLLPLHLILIHFEGLLLALIKGDRTIWSKIYAPLLPALWRQRHRLLSLRQSVQSQRKASLCSWLAPFCWIPWKLRMLIRYGLPKLT
jgi:GT2 family glycosyltransferase